MRLRQLGVVSVAVAMTSVVGTSLTGQSGTVEDHVKAAQTAAGTEYVGLFQQLCSPPAPRPAPPATAGGQPQAGAAPVTGAVHATGAPVAPAGRAAGAPGAPGGRGGRGTPDRSGWYVEPVKVFDNLYFVGQSEFSVWAVNTPDGIIVVDTIFSYSVEAEVVDGLKKMGLDPTKIKYAIVSHGHADHSGGAKFLQERFGTRIIMGAADWDSIEAGPEPKPTRDIVATDGMKVTVGGTSLTVYLTPGHTPGTISTVIPVKDNGKSYTAALWGGTLFNFARGAGPVSPAALNSFRNYAASAQKMRDVVEKGRIEILLSNHTAFDGSKTKLPAVLARKANDPHPYVVGTDSVKRFLTMAGECAQAATLRAAAVPAEVPK